MIEKVNDKSKVYPFLKKYFEDYHTSEDPFEKICIYMDGDIVGVISYSVMYERAEVNYIVVKDDYRRKGIGSKLLKFALDDIKNSDVESISLEVACDNMAATSLYLKYGFIKKTIRTNYYGNKDGYLMVLEVK